MTFDIRDSHSSFQKTRGFWNDILCKLKLSTLQRSTVPPLFTVQEPWTPVTIISYNITTSQKNYVFISEKLAASTFIRPIKRCYVPGD
jgi:hypothetical protein